MSDTWQFTDEEFWALETTPYDPLKNYLFTTSASERQGVLDYLFQLNPQLEQLNTDPRFSELVLTAHYNNFDSEWLYDQLAGADWGRALVLQNMDLASAGSGAGGLSTAQRQANLFASLRDTASQLGLSLDEAAIQTIANTAVDSNWDNAQIVDALMEGADPAAIVSGDITAAADDLLVFAGGIRSGLTADQAINMAIRIARGELTIAGAQSQIRSGASATNPQYASLIEQGLDINTYDTFVNSISTTASRFGISVDPNTVASIAQQATANSWSDMQVQQALLQNVSPDAVWSDGTLIASATSIKDMASSYLLPLSDRTARDYALRIARGQLDEAGLSNMLRNQAKASTPWLSDLIDQGITTRDYFSPLQEYAAGQLEMNASDIDLMNAEWQDVFTTMQDNGITRGATLSEIRSRVRRRSEWTETNEARASASRAVSAVAQMFGLRGF